MPAEHVWGYGSGQAGRLLDGFTENITIHKNLGYASQLCASHSMLDKAKESDEGADVQAAWWEDGKAGAKTGHACGSCGCLDEGQ